MLGAGSDHVLNCVAGAAFWQGRVQISWQAQHFRKVKFSQGLSCVAGAALSKGQVQISCTFARSRALSQCQVQISWQAQHFHKVMYRFRGRCSTFARSSAKFVACASLLQGQVQNSWQVQHFRKVKYRFRGRRSTFPRSTFAAGAPKSQLLSTRSQLSQLGLQNRNC